MNECYCAECRPERRAFAAIASLFGLIVTAAIVLGGAWALMVWVLTA